MNSLVSRAAKRCGSGWYTIILSTPPSRLSFNIQMRKNRSGWLYPLNDTPGLSMTWRAVLSPLVYTHVLPSYSWINLSRSILLFSPEPPSNCSKSWEASSFPAVALWPGVSLSWRNSPASVNSSTNKGMSPFASTCNLTGWAQPCRKAGEFPAPGSHRQIRNRFMLSALILQPTLIVDRPIKQATVGNILASRISRVLLCALLNKSSQSLIWAGQMSSQVIPNSLPCHLIQMMRKWSKNPIEQIFQMLWVLVHVNKLLDLRFFCQRIIKLSISIP